QGTFSDRFHVCALCDINPQMLARASAELNILEESCYLDENVFFSQKRADLLVIATQDKDHVRHVLKGLKLGYDILVEKPLTSSREECAQLLKAQRESGRKVYVGHILRYTPVFLKANELLTKGTIGKLISMTVVEHVWYGHFVHSYVRGPWRRSEDSSPVILAKSSHDLDLIQYFAHSRCESIASQGTISWFKRENAPEGSAERCTECKYMETCPFSAKRLYIDRMKNRPDYSFSTIIVRPKKLTVETAMEAIKTGLYGRCVYRCDNDVVDNQQCLMRFENGVTATFELNAFSGNGGRSYTLHGSAGEIIIDEVEDRFCIKRYGVEEHETWTLSSMTTDNAVHNGGDDGIVRELYEMLTGQAEDVTSLEDSVESHLMGIAAEESRLLGGQRVPVHRA
ncbi:MAG: Gfo/Idh/MocA family oxidoreductase, partial [Clostridia bacterium]|nr:Gfo/Idh/MocA family oxidoreductase [Clostridia bacterium]